MKYIFSTLIVLLFFKITAAQQFDWVQTFGSYTGNESIQDLEVDFNGNVYSCGIFNDSLLFNSSILISEFDSLNGSNAFVIKQDSIGNLIWSKSFASKSFVTARAMKVDSAGNVYVTGEFGGVADFDPNDSTKFLMGDTSSKYLVIRTFVCKLDANGEFVWAKSFVEDSSFLRYSNTSTNRGAVLELDNSGNLIVSGPFQFKTDFDPGSDTFFLNSIIFDSLQPYNAIGSFIVKLDSKGDFISALQIPLLNGFLFRDQLKVDQSNNLYFAGQIVDSLELQTTTGNIELRSRGSSDIAIIKIDSIGEIVW